MKQYHKIITASEKSVDEYLRDGWEIIDTTKSSYDPSGNDTSITYHMGYSLQKQYEDLLSIVRLYEKNGFKDLLFEKMANDEGVDLNEYSTNGGFGFVDPHSVLKIIKDYESIVNGKDVNFYKKGRTDSEFDEIDF